jgi:hypothetical protein
MILLSAKNPPKIREADFSPGQRHLPSPKSAEAVPKQEFLPRTARAATGKTKISKQARLFRIGRRLNFFKILPREKPPSLGAGGGGVRPCSAAA